MGKDFTTKGMGQGKMPQGGKAAKSAGKAPVKPEDKAKSKVDLVFSKAMTNLFKIYAEA